MRKRIESDVDLLIRREMIGTVAVTEKRHPLGSDTLLAQKQPRMRARRRGSERPLVTFKYEACIRQPAEDGCPATQNRILNFGKAVK